MTDDQTVPPARALVERRERLHLRTDGVPRIGGVEREATVGIRGQHHPAPAGGQGIAMLGRDGQPPFRIESKCRSPQKHDSPLDRREFP